MSVGAGVLHSDEIDNKEYTIEHLIKLEDNKIYINLRSNGRVFEIEYGPEDLHDPENVSGSQPFQEQYLDALEHMFGDDEDDKATELSEQQDDFDAAISPVSSECCHEEDPVISFTAGPFLTHETFKTFARKSSTPCLNTLQDVLHPPLLSFSLHIVDGDLVPINQSLLQEHKTRNPPWVVVWKSKHWLEYPRVKAEEVVLAQSSQTSPNVNLVVFNNRICWFKPVIPGVSDLPYIREIDMLFKLSQENLSPGLLRFPQLEAIVLDDRDGDNGFINGLILPAIHPNLGTLVDQLSGPERQTPSIALRERWYDDIESMIHILHGKGFVWGDVSPNNVIIDENENAWIIDFGGGYTDGWIEPDDMETQRGDLEGLKRIKEYLLGIG